MWVFCFWFCGCSCLLLRIGLPVKKQRLNVVGWSLKHWHGLRNTQLIFNCKQMNIIDLSVPKTLLAS
jgi:hypothetical protein